MMKHIKVLLDDRFLGATPIDPVNTISNLKEYGKSVVKHYNMNPNDYITDIYLDAKNKLDLTQISDDLVLGPHLNLFTDPHLHVHKIGANYTNLPPDMKRYLINYVEPIQALELCKTVQCNWEHLLNINYDFVTQGFAPSGNHEQKFRYLAQRVSKNINTNPSIIFIHFNGTPLGKVRFLNINKDRADIVDDDDEDILDMVNERVLTMKSIVNTLSQDPNVEWVQQDDHNTWARIINPDRLPNEIAGEPAEAGGQRYRRILRDNDMYDYPSVRIKNIKTFSPEIQYPGIVNITPDVIKSMLIKLYDNEQDEELDFDNISEMVVEYAQNWDIYDNTPEYNVYRMMSHGFTRSEAEVYSRAFYHQGNFAENLKLLYNFDINTL